MAKLVWDKELVRTASCQTKQQAWEATQAHPRDMSTLVLVNMSKAWTSCFWACSATATPVWHAGVQTPGGHKSWALSAEPSFPAGIWQVAGAHMVPGAYCYLHAPVCSSTPLPKARTHSATQSSSAESVTKS